MALVEAVEAVVVAAAAGRSYILREPYYARLCTAPRVPCSGRSARRSGVGGWPGGRAASGWDRVVVASGLAGRWVKGYRASLLPPLFST